MDQFIGMQSIIFMTFISVIELFPARRQWNFPVFNDAQTQGTELCNQRVSGDISFFGLELL